MAFPIPKKRPSDVSSVLISQGPVFSVITGPADAIERAQATLTVTQPKAQYTRAYKFGSWDGTVKFLHRPNNTFLTGLTDRVAAELKDCAVKISQVGAQHGPPFIPRLLDVELRDYQQRAAEYAVARRRCAIQSPTGSGKTEIGAEIIRQIGRPTLWLTHRKVLLDQTYERLRKLLGRHAVLMVNDLHIPSAFAPWVNVCMVQTLAKIPPAHEFWKRWQVVVIDEAHTMTADTWYTVALRCTNAFYRYGLSGTILTGDPVRDMKLEGITGAVYQAAESHELAAQGFLATPLIKIAHPFAASFPTYEQVREAVYPRWREHPRALRRMGSKLYQRMYIDGVVHNSYYTQAIVDIVDRHSKEKVLILFRDIEHGHGRTICKHIPHALYIDGNTPDANRQELLKRFRLWVGGAVLVASTIFDQGVDIPEIDVLILAGGGASHITTLQRVGRALRPRPDKPTVLIYDMWSGRDPGKKDYLANHSLARQREYTAQGFSVEHVFL